MELTINEAVYQFTFGMGFLREINKSVVMKDIDGMKGIDKNIGLRYAISSILEGDIEALATVLELANKGNTPRLTKLAIDKFLENEATDIDSVFDNVIEGLKLANVTKKTTVAIIEAVAQAQAQAKAK
jgi:hypothetical protein